MPLNTEPDLHGVSLLKKIGLFILQVFFLSVPVMHAAVITFSPGVAYEKKASTQTVLLETSPQNLSNQYEASAKDNTFNQFSALLFLGKDVYKKNNLNMQFGLTLGFVDDNRMSGIVQEFSLPDFDNFNYQYDVHSMTAMATLKMSLLAYDKWRPYLDGGIGIASNKAYHYQETPRIEGAVPMSPYSDHRSYNLAYSLGMGLMYHINSDLSIGPGYQFAHLGSAKLGVSASQQTLQTPTVNHLFLHQLLFNFSWCI